MKPNAIARGTVIPIRSVTDVWSCKRLIRYPWFELFVSGRITFSSHQALQNWFPVANNQKPSTGRISSIHKWMGTCFIVWYIGWGIFPFYQLYVLTKMPTSGFLTHICVCVCVCMRWIDYTSANKFCHSKDVRAWKVRVHEIPLFQRTFPWRYLISRRYHSTANFLWHIT